MAEVQNWDPTDASNTDLFPENMPFGDVNDGGRAVQGVIARWFRDTNASITASGSSNAFAITSNRTISALANDLVMAFTANHSIDGAATLDLNGLGAKDLVRFNGDDLAVGDIISGQPVVAIYKSAADVWFVMSALAASTGNMFADFDENAAPGDPAADDARLYAKDDSAVTRLAYRDSAGSETLLLGPPARAYDENDAETSLTAVIPSDDTIPQITEGTEILSASITLRRASSRVRARVAIPDFPVGDDSNRTGIAALFIVGTANALNACFCAASASHGFSAVMDFEHAPGTVGPHTYTVRAGPGFSGGGGFTINSNIGNARATLVLEEVFVVS